MIALPVGRVQALNLHALQRMENWNRVKTGRRKASLEACLMDPMNGSINPGSCLRSPVLLISLPVVNFSGRKETPSVKVSNRASN